ncbi:MAG: hypothetical protein RJA44_98 [Pseudomonadota bacterium]
MLHWDAETLWLALEPLAPGLTIELLPECGSTNTTLLERARHGLSQPTLLVADRQTAGRGRLGRQWWSAEPGSALTFSLALPLTPQDWSGLSLAVGLTLAEALDQGGMQIGLKWPNDLWLRHDDRKLGGILIETTTLPDATDPATRLAVIGIGLNIAVSAPGGGDYRTGYVGLQELDARWDAPTVLHRVAPALLQALQRFEHSGLAPLRAAYAGRDVLAGRRLQAGAQQGVGAGIGVDGSLLLTQPDGRQLGVQSGEVSVRPC